MSDKDVQLLKYEPSATNQDVRKLQEDVQHLTSIVRELTTTVKTIKQSRCKERSRGAERDETENNAFFDASLQDTSYRNEVVEIDGML